MGAMRRIFIPAIAGVCVLLSVVVLREAFFSLTQYYFLIPGADVRVNGAAVRGWVQRSKGAAPSLFVTWETGGRRESYFLIIFGDGRAAALPCGDWAAPHTPVLPIGDVNPPCISFGAPEPTPSARRLAVAYSGSSIAFDEVISGQRIEARW